MRHILTFFLLILIFFIGFYTSEIIAQKKIKDTSSVGIMCQTQIRQTLALIKGNNKQDICLSTQREKVLENVTESKVYFSYKISQISPTVSLITISLLGGDLMKIDASDLVMNYSENLKIQKIEEGQAFPSYPRIVSENGVITVTGTALLDGTGIRLGQPNKVFVKLLIEKTGDTNQKGSIILDKTSTTAFLQGSSVFDPNLTFSKIEL